MSDDEAIIIDALQAKSRRDLYLGNDGKVHVSYQGPGDFPLSLAINMERRGLLKRRWPEQRHVCCWVLNEDRKRGALNERRNRRNSAPR